MPKAASTDPRPASPGPHRLGSTDPFVVFEREVIEQSIPARFAQQVGRFPDKIAVQSTGGSLTYRELDRLANRIAHAVLAACGESNRAVALLCGPSELWIAAILGSLKAGKIYVPLDIHYLGTRTADILQDSAAQLLLTDASRLEAARALAPPNLPLLRVDTLADDLPAADPGLCLAPDLLAYLFYTSGFVGRFRGVADSHRNVLHNVMRYTNSLHIGAADRLTLLQSCSFSGSVSSLFCALLNGATSLPYSLQDDGPGQMPDWLSRQGITIYHSVPSIFRLLAFATCTYPRLRLIRLEGDQASPRDIALFQTRFPDTCTLVNGLGATECGLVRQFFVTADTPVPRSVVPIGYAVEDMEVLLLDEGTQPVDTGAVGEIAIRSRYLASGYWQRPDLTAAAFLPDPAGGPERIYRTGDLGRQLPDGCLLHLGRKGSQVKIGGLQVETAEVEGALLALPNVQEAAVVAREDRPGDLRLVAYLVPVAPPLATVSCLRKALADALPVHMIPTVYVELDQVPKTPAGKVDRPALPAPDRSRPALDQPPVRPRTPVEAAIAAIWAEALNLDEVGINDEFLELGGTSLAASQVLARIAATLNVSLPVRVLFEASTVAGLALTVVRALLQDLGPEEVDALLPNPPAAGG